MSNDKALAIRPAAIVPSDIGGFADLADRFAKSNMIPGDLRAKPDDVFVTLLAGHELGLTPMASLRAIHVVKGKPILSADTMVALVLGRGSARYFRCVEESDTSVTYETHREGAPEPQRATWTIKDAERAGLSGGDNWKKYPRAMLKARCKAVLARDVYPDVLAGCYEESEREEIEGPRARAHVDAVDAEVVSETRVSAAKPVQLAPRTDALDFDALADQIVEALGMATTADEIAAAVKIGAGANSIPKGHAARARVRDAYNAAKAAVEQPADGAA